MGGAGVGRQSLSDSKTEFIAGLENATVALREVATR